MLHHPVRTIRTLSTLLRFMTSSAVPQTIKSSSSSCLSLSSPTSPTAAATTTTTTPTIEPSVPTCTPSSFSSSTISSSAPSLKSVGKRVPIPANGVDYRGKIVLAPMVRSGELPTRMIALRYGADLVWGTYLITAILPPVFLAFSGLQL